MEAFEQHPIGALLPPLRDDEFIELVSSIGQVGQRVPGMVAEGKVLLGWHRYLACRELGIEFRYEVFEPDPDRGIVDQLSDIVFDEQDLRRAPLTSSQKAMRAQKLKEMFSTEAAARQKASVGMMTGRPEMMEVLTAIPEGRAIDRAAKAMHVSKDQIRRAERIVAAAPAVAAQVESGRVTLKEAEKIIHAPAVVAPPLPPPPPGTIMDHEGIVVPDPVREVFTSDLGLADQIIDALKGVRPLVRQWEEAPCGTASKGEMIRRLELLLTGISMYRPHAVCPSCNGLKAPKCRTCGGDGWLCKQAWNLMESRH